MANQQHLDLLKLGAATWNAWKATQPPDFVADLSDARFIRATLKDVNLNNATLTGADFIESTR